MGLFDIGDDFDPTMGASFDILIRTNVGPGMITSVFQTINSMHLYNWFNYTNQAPISTELGELKLSEWTPENVFKILTKIIKPKEVSKFHLNEDNEKALKIRDQFVWTRPVQYRTPVDLYVIWRNKQLT